MKLYNKFTSIIAGATALVASGLHAAPSDESVIIRITGSSAFRSATHNAIVQLYDSAPVAGYAGADLSGSTRSFFYGTIGGTKTIFTTFWSGSVGGVQVVSGAIPVNFLADTVADAGTLAATGAAAATGGTQLFSSSSAGGTNSQVADVAMSDVYQSSTPFKTPVLTSKRVGVIGFSWLVNRGFNSDLVTKTGVTTTTGSAVISMTDVTGILVGMHVKGTGVSATYVKVNSVDAVNNTVTLSANAIADSTAAATLTFAKPAPFTNINAQQAQALWGSGTASLALFTGVAADASKLVYATGRDPDSGTRLTAFAESGIGVESTVTQYQPTISSGVITALNPYAQQTVNGITFTQGNGGEASGSTLRGFFGNVSTPGLIVSHVGSGDVSTAVLAGGVELTYNGVPYSIDAIKEGRYTFWCYQHLMYQSTLVTAKKSVADALATKIETVTAPIKLTDMKCSRTTDGAVVFHD